MQIGTEGIEAEVYAEGKTSDVLYVKISIPSLRMYINSCTVKPSAKYGGLWFQMPAFLVGRSWIKPIEFQNGSEFFDLLQDAALRAVDIYRQDKGLDSIFPDAKPLNQDEAQHVPF